MKIYKDLTDKQKERVKEFIEKNIDSVYDERTKKYITQMI